MQIVLDAFEGHIHHGEIELDHEQPETDSQQRHYGRILAWGHPVPAGHAPWDGQHTQPLGVGATIPIEI